jgi:hypothetical protein
MKGSGEGLKVKIQCRVGFEQQCIFHIYPMIVFHMTTVHNPTQAMNLTPSPTKNYSNELGRLLSRHQEGKRPSAGF